MQAQEHSNRIAIFKSVFRSTTIILFGVLFIFPDICLSQVQELWVARYNGPSNGPDVAQALAVDAAGNVYVTGYSARLDTGYDYATIKYDNHGNELWLARYPGSAFALAVDASGNVFVTGDTATIKYDTDGNELWVVRYNLLGSGRALALDGAGNVYVTGGSEHYVTIKYDTNGNELWVAGYSGSNFWDFAQALAVDAAGNVYVTGGSHHNLDRFYPDLDYATIKYDTNGNELWVARYNGNGNYTTSAQAIAVDAAGNVYVTGSDVEYDSRSGGRTYGYATIKYDTNGNELWVAHYQGSAYALAVDAAGNVYVTGDTATIKYDTNGNELWVAPYNGLISGTALALDASGNVYVTGGSPDYATIKYDTKGNELWAVQYNAMGSGTALALDASGNVYVTGGSPDYATVNLAQNGADSGGGSDNGGSGGRCFISAITL